MVSTTDATVQVAAFLAKIFMTVIISSHFPLHVALLLWFLGENIVASLFGRYQII